MSEAQIAIIGGSGLYQMEGLKDVEMVDLDTPFGRPSDSIMLGTLDGTRVAFLPRHGRGHRIPPTQIPVQANIYALKTLGVERLISISAVGSLKEALRPLDLVVPDQLIDRTYSRASTFFDSNLVAHIPFAHPFCPQLSNLLHCSATESGATAHLGGTYVVMEGPAFSTLAESQLYRSWGADVIGMTALPEAKLAREAEMCYATLACVTDYDCWHESEGSVSVDMILANLARNTRVSIQVLRSVIPQVTAHRSCQCGCALEYAIATARDAIGPSEKERLSALVDKYLG